MCLMGYKQIKLLATLHNKTLSEFVLECVKQRILRESENNDPKAMMTSISPAVKDLRDNEKDAFYIIFDYRLIHADSRQPGKIKGIP